MTYSNRIAKLREKVFTTPELCVERAFFLTQSYRETESEPVIIRRAKALDKILKGITVSIDDGELIVGKITSKSRGAAMAPEVRWDWYLDEIDTISTREWDKYAPLREDEKAKMRNFIPYFKIIK